MATNFAGEHEPPPNILPPPLMSPSGFSSLPDDIVWVIFARVPKPYLPILSCVCKNFGDLVRSPEIQRNRALLRKDSVYVCFSDYGGGVARHWFKLARIEDRPPKNQFVAVNVPFPYQYEPNPLTIAIGPEIFFFGGSYIPSSFFWIFDSRSGQCRQGPDMEMERSYNGVGFVGGKIYAIGHNRDNDIHVESFDLKTQTWEPAPFSEPEESFDLLAATASIDRKLCVFMFFEDFAVCYDPKDGSCEKLELPMDDWWATGVCVIDNVLYVYYARLGLMWYDSKLKQWRVVTGLDNLGNVPSVAMAEYYGAIAFLWEESSVESSETKGDVESRGETKGDVESSHVPGETKEIWFRTIALYRSEGGIHGIAEPSHVLASVPRGYKLHQSLSVSD